MKTRYSKHENFEYIVGLLFLSIALMLYSIWTLRPLNNLMLVGVVTLAMFLFAIWHAYLNIGFRNTTVLLAIVSLGTWLTEYLGVSTGRYHYLEFLKFKIGGVPFLVMAMWVVVIYTSYLLSEHITDYRFRKRMSLGHKTVLSTFSAAIAGFIAVSWDLAVDPLAVLNGWWIWTPGGPYFSNIGGGIPIANFVGWFILVFILVFVYKMFFEREFLVDENEFQFAPVLAYLLMYVSVIGWAIQLDQMIFAYVASFTMLPYVFIVAIRYFINWYKLPPLYR